MQICHFSDLAQCWWYVKYIMHWKPDTHLMETSNKHYTYETTNTRLLSADYMTNSMEMTNSRKPHTHAHYNCTHISGHQVCSAASACCTLVPYRRTDGGQRCSWHLTTAHSQSCCSRTASRRSEAASGHDTSSPPSQLQPSSTWETEIAITARSSCNH